MRRRALRHGHARAARRLRADLGTPGAAVLAGGDPARAGAGSGLPLHGRGLLGSRMDDAAAGLRLRLRQAALRPAARGARAAGARAPVRRARLPGEARPVPGEPRRAPGRRDLSRRDARGRRRHHVSVARAALLPSGAVRGPEEAHLAAPGPSAAGARRRGAPAVLRRPAGGAPAARRSRRPVAPARMRAGLGRQLDVGRLHRLVLGGRGRRAAARSPSTTPGTRASAMSGFRWPIWPAATCGSRT